MRDRERTVVELPAMDFRYTKGEKTVKRFHINRVVKQAQEVIGARIPICTNALHRYPSNAMLTCEELNTLVEAVVLETTERSSMAEIHRARRRNRLEAEREAM